MKNNLKIAITGGSGFIGTRLIKTLKDDGHETNIIDIADNTPVDILDQEKLNAATAGHDVIYHLAAQHRDDVFPRSLYYDVNGTGTQNVVKAAEVNNIKKIVFTSTVAVYALGEGVKDEKSPVAPFNDYGKSKLEAEEHLKAWASADAERSVTIVRPVVVFGENNRGNVHTLMNQIARGKFMMIGRGKNKKSMAYVGNIANFLKFCAARRENFETLNYADKPDLETRTLVNVVYDSFGKKKPKLYIPYSLGILAGFGFDMLARMTGKTFPISMIRVQKFCADTVVSSDKAMQLGYSPEYSLSDGVRRMIDHDFNGTKK